MNIQDLGSLGELIAAIATVATLIYLAMQIKLNTKTVRSAAFAEANRSINELNLLLTTDPRVAGIVVRGMEGEELDRDETMTFGYFMTTWLRQLETLWVQVRDDIADQELWGALEQPLRNAMNSSACRAWWKNNNNTYIPEFTRYVNEVIQDVERQGGEFQSWWQDK